MARWSRPRPSTPRDMFSPSLGAPVRRVTPTVPDRRRSSTILRFVGQIGYSSAIDVMYTRIILFCERNTPCLKLFRCWSVRRDSILPPVPRGLEIKTPPLNLLFSLLPVRAVTRCYWLRLSFFAELYGHARPYFSGVGVWPVPARSLTRVSGDWADFFPSNAVCLRCFPSPLPLSHVRRMSPSTLTPTCTSPTPETIEYAVSRPRCVTCGIVVADAQYLKQ